jgi:hypothetical protein
MKSEKNQILEDANNFIENNTNNFKIDDEEIKIVEEGSLRRSE